MPRKLKLAAAQVGAIDRETPRSDVLPRLLSLLEQAHAQSVKLVVYPELTFTTFFPRHNIGSLELSSYCEHTDPTLPPNPFAPLFARATEYGIDIVVGYAERVEPGIAHNTCIYYSASKREILSKYRKIHLPGTKKAIKDPAVTNQLEKRYFAVGKLGFNAFRAPNLIPDVLKAPPSAAPPPAEEELEELTEKEMTKLQKYTQGKGDPIVGLMICNDRRWPEAWRALALQGAEIVVYGYNTGAHMPRLRGTRADMTADEAEREALFHSRLVQQSNSYMNACFSVGAARCGDDDGKYSLIAGSAIVDPEGHVVAEAVSKGDELVVAEVDLEDCWPGKSKTFNFELHRRTEAYGRIGSQTGVIEPPLLDRDTSRDSATVPERDEVGTSVEQDNLTRIAVRDGPSQGDGS